MPSEIDNSVVKKAKRRLFAEIELSDQELLIYKGISLSRSDCEAVVESLENPGLISFYSYLLSKPSLNDFLVNGDECFLHHFQDRQESQDPAFRKLISPYLAASLDKALLKFFRGKDAGKLQCALQAQILLEPADLYKAHEGLNREIQYRTNRVDRLTEKIRKQEGEEIAVTDLVAALFPVDLLNVLPADFQCNINKAASAINILAIALHETEPGNAFSQQLYNWILQLNLEAGNRLLIQGNLQVVKEQELLHKNGACFFCQKNPADAALAIQLTMYKQTAMDGDKYTCDSTTVKINQCENCMQIDARARRISSNVFWCFTGFGLVLSAILALQKHRAPTEKYVSILILLIALLVAGFLTANVFRSRFLKKHQQRRRASDIDLHRDVASRLREGWTLSKPNKYGKLPED